MLPAPLQGPLREHIEGIRFQFDKDRKAGCPGVYVPFALDRKYPNLGKRWGWQWLFPSRDLSLIYTRVLNRGGLAVRSPLEE